jgi:membrane associated rhomboid family serine protease
MARTHRALDREMTILGLSVPLVVVALISLTLTFSIVAGVLRQSGVITPFELGVFTPRSVLEGQVWRLVTWVFLELQALSLVFGCLALFWFGSELARAWGPLRFVLTYLAISATGAGVTTLVSTVWASLGLVPYLGMGAVVTSLIVAWASLFPNRPVFVYFVLPMRGRNLIIATLAGTILFALLDGVWFYIPHFAAQAATLLYMRGLPFGEWWLRARYAMAERRFRRRAHKFKVVGGRDEPPRWLH